MTSPKDPRAESTKRAIELAFGELYHERKFEDIRVKDILARADIGRTTFYEYFRSKEDLLVSVMTPFFELVAELAFSDKKVGELERFLQHLHETRADFEFAMRGDSVDRIRNQIAERICNDINRCEKQRTNKDLCFDNPAEVISQQIAAAQISLLASWFNYPDSTSISSLCAALGRSSKAILSSYRIND